MNKSIYSISLGFALSSSLFAKQKPNIVLILADDQRAYGTIHATGGDEIITPNIDQLVKSGTTFTNSYIMGGSQAAVSAPSRNMLMTGRNLFSLGSKGGLLIADEQMTMGECLGKAGYSTFGTGKWHNNADAFTRTFQNGDDIFLGGMTDQFNVPLNHYDPTGKFDHQMPNPSKKNQSSRADHFYAGKHSSEIFKDAAVKFIQNYKEEKPFFLYVSFTSPHDPRNMPPKYLAMYDTAKIKVPINFLPMHPFDNGELSIRDEKLADFPRTTQEIKGHIRDYYAMMTHLDAQVGEIVRTLKEKGLYENTIIIYTGDNGLALGQHGLMGKQNVYECSVNVPLIVSGKDIPKGEINNHFVYLFDIFPTVCALTDTKVPLTVQGQSFIGNNTTPRTSMLYAYKNFQRAVRQGDWKLIEYTVNGVKTTQLFNIKNDPFEMNNLADLIVNKELLATLRVELNEQRKLNNDSDDLLKTGVYDKGSVDTARK
ncbi:MAG: sulfatase-like hydrolase/transferase [Bacteroidia bacterium]|nr:sulfatase-like hydrolase/transferase [Bacteroidia bacterium]